MNKATIEMKTKALMNLYNLPLFVGSSSFISDKAKRFLAATNTVHAPVASHERQARALWTFKRRTHVNCLGLAAFSFSGNMDVFEPVISTREKLLGFSIVSTTEPGAIFPRIPRRKTNTQIKTSD